MYVQTTGTLLSTLTQMLAVGGVYHLPNAALFTNDIQPTRARVLADFTIADFGGLTNIQPVVFGAPFLNADQAAEALAALVNWLTTGSTGLPVTAYGIVLLNTGSTALLNAERFAQPFTFDVAGKNLGVIPRLVVDT